MEGMAKRVQTAASSAKVPETTISKQKNDLRTNQHASKLNNYSTWIQCFQRYSRPLMSKKQELKPSTPKH
eukprot:6464633-Amphidinium_carterae.1